MFDYPNHAYLCMMIRGCLLRMYRILVGKCTTSTECKSIRIAESLVMEGWKDHYLAQCWFCFKNMFLKNKKKLDGVLGGYCHSVKVNGQST
jgi:hypothetical protein